MSESHRNKLKDRAKEKTFSFIINIFVTKKRYILLAIIELALFSFFYYIISPANFGSFSNTLRYFISALGTLLAVVVSFNTLALQNQIKNMPNTLKQLDGQLEKIGELLKPILNVRETDEENQLQKDHGIPKEVKQYQTENTMIFKNAVLFFTDALESMFVVVMHQAKNILPELDNKDNYDNDKSNAKKKDFRKVISDIVEQLSSRLVSYKKNNKNPYYLISLSSTLFIQQLNFNSFTFSSEKIKIMYENIRKLHILRNIGIRIYIRNMLANLSYEMLIFTIPVIAYTAVISSISNYESYDTLFLRILFALSISTAAMPFVLLLVRTIPILHIVKGSSSIPFANKRQ